MKKIINNRGMLSLEYAIFIVVLIACLLAMSVYLKQAISGKLREAGDTFGYGRQYVP